MADQPIDPRRIQRILPDFVIQHARALGAGQYNDVVLVNEELVVRLPRYPAALAEMAREVDMLRGLRGCLPLAIPDPLYAAVEGHELDSAFMAYRPLPGEPLTPEYLAAIADEATSCAPAHYQRFQPRWELAEQLTGFLRALHAVPPERCGARLRDVAGYAAWADLYARFRAHLLPRMRPAARHRVAADFEAYLDAAASANIPRVLVHGDFGPGNILYDAKRGAISGILDWSSAGLGDPAVDLASLVCAVGYGEAFARLGFAVYPELESMLPRARFYASTFALQEALFGVESGDEAAFERGIADYR